MGVEEDGAILLQQLRNRIHWPEDAKDAVIAWFRSHRLQLPEPMLIDFERWMSVRIGDFTHSKMKFRGLLPDHSWLGRYLDYTDAHEAAEIFHFWVGVSALSAAIGRRMWFDQSYFRVNCNHFIILVGPTGTRKTAAADIGIDMLQESMPTHPIIYEKVTPEAMLEALSRNRKRRGMDNAEYCEAMVYAPELAVFLGRQSYNESLVPLITSIADSKEHPMDYLTKHQGKFRMPRATMTILGCSTQQWLADALPPSAHTGGFMGRFVHVVCNTRGKLSAFPEKPPDHLRRYLVDYLTSLSSIEGVITQTAEAKEWHVDWYNSLRITNDNYLAGFHERKQSHMMRLAMVFMLAEDPQQRQLTSDLYQRALRAIDETEKYMPDAFSQVDQSDEGKLHARVLMVLKSSGGWVPKSALMRMTYKTVGSARKLAELLLTLEQAGLAESTHAKDGTSYRITARAAQMESFDELEG